MVNAGAGSRAGGDITVLSACACGWWRWRGRAACAGVAEGMQVVLEEVGPVSWGAEEVELESLEWKCQ